MSTTATPSETPSSASGSARARQGFCHGPHTRDTDVLQFTQISVCTWRPAKQQDAASSFGAPCLGQRE